MTTCTEERFLDDVANHEISVLRDEGVYRHVRFQGKDADGRPTSNQWFEMMTWPGMLCLNGDMGTYVFSRLQDMFEFFRMEDDARERAAGRLESLAINPSYWAEKLQADARGGGHTEFAEDQFRAAIKEGFDYWVEENCINDDVRDKAWSEVEDEILFVLDDGEEVARNAAANFSFEPGLMHGGALEFNDLWEHKFQKHSYHYEWCCYALAWGVDQYDTWKEAQKEEESYGVSNCESNLPRPKG